MELVFLAILLLAMIVALSSGYPVAFSLPGAAILSIGLAAFFGYLFAGDSSAYFVEGGPFQWLSAGVTNFRSLYWDVERDTLIAVPLFIFMGIMLQRSKIAEDLLVTMAQLFGPVPGGLGISVVLVGALLAATTGIVGATVIAMGLISLPAMLRNNYSKPLATGTICASGTLGQIIPPSIVLIILADQLTGASDQASTLRKASYKAATGEFSMPSVLDVTSTSAGEMFMGALVPGLVLVGLYIMYILIAALVRKGSAPPVPYDGKFDRKFAKRVALALIPPLTLILLVLGSIILGVATVNQAGAVGAIGAMIMGGYRLAEGRRNAYYPAILAVVSTVVIAIILSFYDLNVKSIKEGDAIGIFLAAVAAAGLLVAVAWSTWRIYKIENTLNWVMVETAKTTSMVFIILLGAAMLTSAFRGFGGEELVKHFLTNLEGGFWVQFIVVMAVMFVLGFFLDFLEIAVVVVPIVAPILLADPGANVTAVWFGVMVGLNLQTSFLTPPFGFSLFYLRGVAPPSVKTLEIYRGAAPFIVLQLIALVIVALTPAMVNYLPTRISLSAETAPPPINPRLQYCMEEFLFDYYDVNAEQLRGYVSTLHAADLSALPAKRQKALIESLDRTLNTFDLVAKVRMAEENRVGYSSEYRPQHRRVRGLQSQIRNIRVKIVELKQNLTRASRSDSPDKDVIIRIEAEIGKAEVAITNLQDQIPESWAGASKRYAELEKAEKQARRNYRNNIDQAYETIVELGEVIEGVDDLAGLEPQMTALETAIPNEPAQVAMERIKQAEKALGKIAGTSAIKSKLSRARRALKGKNPKPEKAIQSLSEGLRLYAAEVDWRRRAAVEIGPALASYDDAIKDSIGLRLQRRLSDEQVKEVASCLSVHRDFSLQF
ncbi:TRAP dicarboxylate transporter, DctM subunit, unknown substrate 6 [Olavius algarvensis associated proteobacterium Delta 3]|nr:TRAP dicarboxylate transporter, DctM subunit, unknown substrate 6 [Olavius algarvensis associated proteobacterium Delta 3]CAB5159443.1 TRAP dicarboxylate transporter, DctM subunit, unknown substrate 6 [Olavius algarvensis associated proteobacterium Delta 3]